MFDRFLFFSLVADRQYELTRVADAAIDIYSILAVLSRVTYSLNHNASSAGHESDIAKYFVDVVSYIFSYNLK